MEIRMLRSFQIFHQKYNINPSKVGFCFLSKDRRIRFHPPLMVCEGVACRSCLPSCDVKCVCWGVSEKPDRIPEHDREMEQ
jgi:hypothetical protein